MKLKYTKPAFAVERFDLAQSIAAGCMADPSSSIGDPNWGSRDTCGWRVGNYIIWTESSCITSNLFSIFASPDDEVMGVCYNNPNGDNVIFGS